MDEQRTDMQSRERIAVLETELREIKRQHKEMADDIKLILSTLSEARGGWKMMMLVGGSAGALGAFVSKWISPIIAGLPK